jgi:hypothetical protein
MECNDCPLKYIGQTGRTLNTRYKEHIHAIRSNNSNTGFANHILNTGHRYGTISNTMKIIKAGKKGKHLNTLEKYYIHRASRNNLQLNDTNIDLNNPIFDTLHEIYTGPQHQQHT